MQSPGLELIVRPLTPERLDDFAAVQRGGYGATCWCMFPRLRGSEYSDPPGHGEPGDRRRAALAALAGRRRPPGLLGYEHREPVGWVAIAPRGDLARVDRSRATPRVDDVDVWVIPCVTVRRSARGRGVAIRMLRAAVELAGRHGAPAVEGYPRAAGGRTRDANAYFGTEAMFRKAGFEVVRPPLEGLPRTWVPRPAMRVVPAP